MIVTSDKCYENREWIWGYREIDRIGGFDPYSSSKGCAELVTAAYRQSYFTLNEAKRNNVSIASARAGNVIGGGDFAEDRLIPDLVRAVIKDEPVSIRYPKSTRPWQHVLDPLSGYLLLSEKLYQNRFRYSEAWNFGPFEEDVKEVRWIVDRFSKLWGQPIEHKIFGKDNPHEGGMLKLNCSKATTKLGWRPYLGIEEALKWTVEWYKAYLNYPSRLRCITEKQIEIYEDYRIAI